MEQWNKHTKNPQNVGVPTVLPVPATGTTRNNAEQSSLQHIALTAVNKLCCCIIISRGELSSKGSETTGNKKPRPRSGLPSGANYLLIIARVARRWTRALTASNSAFSAFSILPIASLIKLTSFVSSDLGSDSVFSFGKA